MDHVKTDFLHSLFVLKSMLGAEFAKAAGERETLSMPEYILMKKAAEAENGNADLAEIREYLAVTKAAVSQMLSSLEKTGFLKRETDPANRRNLIITITASGMDILRQKDLEAEMRMEKIILRFGKEETLQFIQLISKMNETMKTLQEE